MKSILGVFRMSKVAILTILEALNFDFNKDFTLENVVKIAVLGLQNDQN